MGCLGNALKPEGEIDHHAALIIDEIVPVDSESRKTLETIGKVARENSNLDSNHDAKLAFTQQTYGW